jgi:hypothetical protein
MGQIGITYHPNEKTSVIADCLEKRFISHDLCDENHERRVETGVQVLLPPADDTALEEIRPRDIQKLVKDIEFEKGLWI